MVLRTVDFYPQPAITSTQAHLNSQVAQNMKHLLDSDYAQVSIFHPGPDLILRLDHCIIDAVRYKAKMCINLSSGQICFCELMESIGLLFYHGQWQSTRNFYAYTRFQSFVSHSWQAVLLH